MKRSECPIQCQIVENTKAQSIITFFITRTMNKNREKAVSLAGEEQVRELEHAFNSFLYEFMRLGDRSSQNWDLSDFSPNYLRTEAQDEKNIQALNKLGANGIEVQMVLGDMWVACEPIDMEEC